MNTKARVTIAIHEFGPTKERKHAVLIHPNTGTSGVAIGCKDRAGAERLAYAIQTYVTVVTITRGSRR